MIHRYETKPCEIEAIEFTRCNWDKIVEFTKGKAKYLTIVRNPFAPAECLIDTLEGDMIATEGDFIIKGLRGEFYPCKPDIFKKKYELLDIHNPKIMINIRDIGEVSDGSHTFNELYYHRMVLFSVICNLHKDKSWKAFKHSDGEIWGDYFIVGVETEEGNYTYHYHKDHWDMFKVKELELAPEWDGHKPEDITRLLTLIK